LESPWSMLLILSELVLNDEAMAASIDLGTL
jgi:hypothetical protein